MFKAVLMSQTEDRQPVMTIENLEDSFLSADGDVIVRVRYAGLNYKDGLCLNGQGGLIREFPRIPGVEFAGEVLKSRDVRYACLLYTSPSPRDSDSSRMPSSA